MKIKNILKLIYCKHRNTDKIIIHDHIYDSNMDNDDLDDPRTFLEIEYCSNCGKILNMKHKWENCISFTLPYKCSINESLYEDIEKFEKITGYDTRNMTLYKKNMNRFY